MAASDGLTVEGARQVLREGRVEGLQFQLLRLVGSLVESSDVSSSVTRELLIRILDRRNEFAGYDAFLNALLRTSGLFAYIDRPGELPTSDLLALEAHRPLDFPDEAVVFHPIQARAYRYLLGGRSVILSAPTSFGKSLVLDAVLRSGRFDNVAVVVPTLALIDETRRRLAQLRSGHKVVSHPSQEFGRRNVLVMTQERLLELPELPALDLFMVDEFYKLSLSGQDVSRSVLLNQALRRLMKTRAPFYFTGPNVQQLAAGLPNIFEASFIATDYATVAVDLQVLPSPRRSQRPAALVELCSSLEGPTLIYCSSPAAAREAARALLDAGLGSPASGMDAAAAWVGREFHPGWLVGRAMREGIGIHHGKLPRALAQFQVDAFNAGKLRWLVCTSTLIEGVNTTAKNVVMYNHTLNGKALDYFSFANIRGRSGRMRRHFVGNVYVFRPPPQEDLPTVDIPLYSQTEDVPSSLLIQLDADEMTESARVRMADLLDQESVPVEILRQNSGVDPQAQIRLAQHIDDQIERYVRLLAWSGPPTYDQLLASCQLVVRFLHPLVGRQHEVASAEQLAFKLNQARSAQGDIRELVLQELGNARSRNVNDPDGAVEAVLDFMRHWPGFLFPKLLMALQSLVRPRLNSLGQDCDYSSFAAASLNLYMPDQVVVLEEYGLPSQTAEKLMDRLRPYTGLDMLLERLARVDPDTVDDEFDRELLRRTQETL